jgi:hypothetical protein
LGWTYIFPQSVTNQLGKDQKTNDKERLYRPVPGLSEQERKEPRAVPNLPYPNYLRLLA